MRRLYATIWSMTPTMSQDETTKTWLTKWGGARSAAHTGQVTAPSSIDVELFEGADEQVKLAKKKAVRPARREKKQIQIAKSQGHRPERSLLGDDGYTQGIVPAI
jgi:hypothetical protein